MKPTRPCLVKVGDEVTPTNPEYMAECIGTVIGICFRKLTVKSDVWCWRVRIKLHKPWVIKSHIDFESIGSELNYIHRSDTELKIVPKRIGEIVNNA